MNNLLLLYIYASGNINQGLYKKTRHFIEKYKTETRLNKRTILGPLHIQLWQNIGTIQIQVFFFCMIRGQILILIIICAFSCVIIRRWFLNLALYLMAPNTPFILSSGKETGVSEPHHKQVHSIFVSWRLLPGWRHSASPINSDAVKEKKNRTTVCGEQTEETASAQHQVSTRPLFYSLCVHQCCRCVQQWWRSFWRSRNLKGHCHCCY